MCGIIWSGWCKQFTNRTNQSYISSWISIPANQLLVLCFYTLEPIYLIYDLGQWTLSVWSIYYLCQSAFNVLFIFHIWVSGFFESRIFFDQCWIKMRLPFFFSQLSQHPRKKPNTVCFFILKFIMSFLFLKFKLHTVVSVNINIMKTTFLFKF